TKRQRREDRRRKVESITPMADERRLLMKERRRVKSAAPRLPETPEQKQGPSVWQKAAKSERRRRELAGRRLTTDRDNPFGDRVRERCRSERAGTRGPSLKRAGAGAARDRRSVDDLDGFKKVDIGVYQKLERQSGLTEGACREQRETFWSLRSSASSAARSDRARLHPAASSATAAVADRESSGRVIRGKSANQLARVWKTPSQRFRICAGQDRARIWPTGRRCWTKLKVAKGEGYGWQELHKGYKFNIFYPDLLDKSKAPSYSTEPCKDDPQFAIPALHCWAAL
uniref:DIRP domain-containing protein n=1 Tax=Macrostomum lignano TaxID=282301 RepID=A0A1I8FAP1_9PLAT